MFKKNNLERGLKSYVDELKKIEIEAKKIEALIIGYTKEGSIIATLDLLDDAIIRGDKDEILYHFKDIDKWYKKNISNISMVVSII